MDFWEKIGNIQKSGVPGKKNPDGVMVQDAIVSSGLSPGVYHSTASKNKRKERRKNINHRDFDLP